MAQTKKKRRRKHRGTQTGRIDTRPAKGRPRNRAEAQARARSRQGKGKGKGKGKGQPQRGAVAPTWGNALKKGLIAGAIFFVLLAVAFRRPLLPSAAIAALMLGFYVPMAYLTDRFFYQRQVHKEQKEQLAKSQQRSGQ